MTFSCYGEFFAESSSKCAISLILDYSVEFWTVSGVLNSYSTYDLSQWEEMSVWYTMWDYKRLW